MTAILKKEQEPAIAPPGPPSTHLWQTAAVRHLAWLCHAPQLSDNDLHFDLAGYLPEDLPQRLARLDAQPRPLETLLAAHPSPRLGFYFERLYQFLLTELLGWRILLMNEPVRENGRTVGELDFIVENPRERRIEHHEVAVKFYLGYTQADGSCYWFGPNAKDRLDRKVRRLTHHQCRLTRHPAARRILAQQGIGESPLPRLFMPGYLFYPAGTSMASPAGVPPRHERGDWCRVETLDPASTASWHCLMKPHWLGRYQSPTPPDQANTRAVLDAIRAGGAPRLFASMAPRPDGRGWEEAARTFVVPAHWPEEAP
ncbi:DUF1853 family protein [Marinobacter halodurans]|uniref:DUF1853 family protein n=1 Tax=Marinobacter halodurans TaxID=2528979 RepID=UPI0013F1701C|nr:DUF1853 family protein [Marinobacter halodurans]